VNALLAYRDDGLLAALIGRRSALRFGGLPLLVLGALPVLVVLAAAGDALPPDAVGLVALAFLVAAAGAGARHAGRGRFAWMVPPLLRALEYGLLIRLTAVADHHALPACYALVGVLAFHHYDTVYRLRHQRVAPPAWLAAAGGGWDGRLLVVYVLAALGVLGVGLPLVAAALAVLFVSESVTSWLRFAHAERPRSYGEDDADDELEGA
jgi:hypothetical protein